MDLNEAKIIAEMNHDGFPLGKIMAMYPVTHDALNWALGELEASKTATDYAALEAERDEWRRRTYRIVGHIEEADSIDLHAIIAIAEGRDNG